MYSSWKTQRLIDHTILLRDFEILRLSSTNNYVDHQCLYSSKFPCNAWVPLVYSNYNHFYTQYSNPNDRIIEIILSQNLLKPNPIQKLNDIAFEISKCDNVFEMMHFMYNNLYIQYSNNKLHQFLYFQKVSKDQFQFKSQMTLLLRF